MCRGALMRIHGKQLPLYMSSVLSLYLQGRYDPTHFIKKESKAEKVSISTNITKSMLKFIRHNCHWARQCTFVIRAAWKAEVERLQVQDEPGQFNACLKIKF